MIMLNYQRVVFAEFLLKFQRYGHASDSGAPFRFGSESLVVFCGFTMDFHVTTGYFCVLSPSTQGILSGFHVTQLETHHD